MILGTNRPLLKCLELEYFEILDFFLVVDIFIYVVNYLGDGIQV